jgi:hypothetical protein
MPSYITNWRRPLWLALLIVAGIALTLSFACAMPFAAFGAAAALTLERREALLLTSALWLANQIVGFAVLGYPWTGETLIWGAVLGVVAVLTTVAAQTAVDAVDRRGAIVAALAGFAAAVVVYEGALFVVSAVALGGIEDFTASIVLRILEINAAAFAILLLVSRLAERALLVGGGALAKVDVSHHA